jgi:hypothetical protein
MYKCKKEKSTREYSKKQRGIIRSKHHHNSTIFKVDIYRVGNMPDDLQGSSAWPVLGLSCL